MPHAMRAAIPVLRVFSEDKAREFYVGFLGFCVDWEHRDEPGMPLYMQVSRNALVLHLSEHYGDACPGSTLRAGLVGIDAYHRELSAKEYGFLRPGVEPRPWGHREMEVIDPFGNRIRFFEEIAAEEGWDG